MAFRVDARFLSLAFLLIATTGVGQISAPPAMAMADDPPDSGIVIKKRVDEVNLLFSVVDNKGRFVNKLQLQDFNLLDNQRPPVQIRKFQQESDLPLRVALLIDVSGSVTGRFKFEQEAASKFLKKILRPATDKALVLGFDQRVHLEQDFTSDIAALAAAVHRLKPQGETALFDAIVFAAEKLRE